MSGNSSATATQDLSAKKIVNQLKKGKKAYDSFGEILCTQYTIAGKLMNEWREHFKVTLPPDANTQTLQTIDARLMELHEEATFLKARCNAKLHALRDVNAASYRRRYAELVAEYKSKQKKLPAKDTLAALAENDNQETKDQIVHPEIELDFWKAILEDLNYKRRLVENMTLNISVEAKALQNQKYIDALNRDKR